MVTVNGYHYCCYKAAEWEKHAEEMSEKLTKMIPTKKCNNGTPYRPVYKEVEDLEQLDSEKLNDTRDFARKLLTNKFLHTNEWTHEKLVGFEQRITTQIEVIFYDKLLL